MKNSSLALLLFSLIPAISFDIYFNEEKNRNEFIEFIKKENYKAEGTFNKKTKLYSAHISRVDKVDLPSINQITVYLRKIAARFKGDYDGWETILIKD